jgi:hypothetical protein
MRVLDMGPAIRFESGTALRSRTVGAAA